MKAELHELTLSELTILLKYFSNMDGRGGYNHSVVMRVVAEIERRSADWELP